MMKMATVHKRYRYRLGVLLVLLSLVGYASASAKTTTALLKRMVHHIDVGQADSILVQTPTGKNMLIDAGNNDDGLTLLAYFKKQGAKRLDIVVGTHPHEDHIGAMDDGINAYPVG